MGGELNPYDPPRAPLEASAPGPGVRPRRTRYLFGFVCLLGLLALASLVPLFLFQ